MVAASVKEAERRNAYVELKAEQCRTDKSTFTDTVVTDVRGGL